ncbi:membrane protein FAM174B [Thomomys bottae]
MTPCDVLVAAAAAARVLPGSAASCARRRARVRNRGSPRAPRPICSPAEPSIRQRPIVTDRPIPAARAMRAPPAPPPPPPPPRLLWPLLLALLAAPGARARRAESPPAPPPAPDRPAPGPAPRNATRAEPGPGASNSSGDALVTRVSTLLRGLPALKAAAGVACVLSALLVAGLLRRVCRSGKRLKKTRKYDIITTPAERVEMAPLNEEEEEDEEATVFDIKYR